MSSTVEAKKPAAEKRPAPAKPVKEKKAKAAPKDKKPKAAKTAAHPTYFEMIKEALSALKEKSGSSPYAIAKYMEDKHKAVLPGNFRKILGLQLKNSAKKGKLIKIKASYKLSESVKKVSVAKPAEKKTAAAAATKKPKTAVKATKKPKTAAKAPTATAGTKRKAEVGKKKVAAKKVVKKAATPAKAKQPKSIKSPVAKRAKRATAAA